MNHIHMFVSNYVQLVPALEVLWVVATKEKYYAEKVFKEK